MPSDSTAPLRVAVIGATGYSGQELLRRLSRHPHVRITGAFGSAQHDAARPLPALARIFDDPVQPYDEAHVARDADAAFIALPESAAATIAPGLCAQGVRVIDLSGAFRLRDVAQRAAWYPATPTSLPADTVYGLAEFHADALRRARLISCPGCYPTATLLGTLPLERARLLDRDADLVVDAKSGISGAGKGASDRTHFSENHGSIAAYAPFAHRHTPEMEQELGRGVAFVPHLVPLDRGLMSTIHTRVAEGVTDDVIAGAFADAYATAPFIRLRRDALPEIKHVVHTNFCDIGWRLDRPTRRLVVVSVIDNLVKGAAGQAIQNFNIAAGCPETAGLL